MLDQRQFGSRKAHIWVVTTCAVMIHSSIKQGPWSNRAPLLLQGPCLMLLWIRSDTRSRSLNTKLVPSETYTVHVTKIVQVDWSAI